MNWRTLTVFPGCDYSLFQLDCEWCDFANHIKAEKSADVEILMSPLALAWFMSVTDSDGSWTFNGSEIILSQLKGGGIISFRDARKKGGDTMRKFKAGDLIRSIDGSITNRVVRVIEGIERIDVNWVFGQEAMDVSDSYLLYDEKKCCHFTSPFGNEGWWSLVDPSMGLSRGDMVEIRHKWGVGTDGPYELVEAVYTERSVSYDWCGGLKHPRTVKDCWIAKTASDEYIIIDFSELSLVSVITAPKHAGFCPRCGEKMVEKMSMPFIGGEEFKVKKCVSCGNCL